MLTVKLRTRLVVKREIKLNVVAVAIFYSALFLLALIWNQLRSLILMPRTSEFSTLTVIWQLLLVFAIAAIVIAGCYYSALRFNVMHKIGRNFYKFLYPLGLHDIFLISLFSAVGEEFFFRGILQGELGIVGASLIFGLLHIGPKSYYLAWTAFATVVGFILGLLYIFTDNILAPVVCHFMINGVNLYLLRYLSDDTTGEERDNNDFTK